MATMDINFIRCLVNKMSKLRNKMYSVQEDIHSIE